MAKAKTKKKPAKAKASGGGFGAAAASTKIVVPGQPPEIEKALSLKAKALVKSPKNPQAWLEMGALLVKVKEYAEAERIFRAGAERAPEKMVTGAALTFGGDSASYYYGEPKERPSVLSASSLPPLDEKLTDAGFDGYAVPPELIFNSDQADRAIDWNSGKDDVLSRGAIFKSKGPLLDPSECAWVIEQVEKHAEESGGWTTARHVEAPTTDVPVSKVPAIREWFDKQLRDVLFPMLHARYPTLIAGPHELRVQDAFVVRYDAGAQASLPVHQDENVFSFTIALNDRSEYEGGGTSFGRIRPTQDQDAEFAPAILNADAGGVVTFAGKLQHGGNTVTKGRRYIIPLFIYADVNLSGRKPGYLMEQLQLPAPAMVSYSSPPDQK